MTRTNKTLIWFMVMFLFFAGASSAYTWIFSNSMLELKAIQSEGEYENEYDKRRPLFIPFFAYLESHPEIANDINMSLSGVSIIDQESVTFNDFLKRCYFLGLIGSFALSLLGVLLLSIKSKKR